MIEEIEIEKKQISCYRNRLDYLKKLYEEKKLLYYELSGLKGINYENSKSMSYNKYAIEHKKIKISEKITKLEKKIKNEEKEIDIIEKKLRKINRLNEKRKIIIEGEEKNIYPSEIIIDVLCQRKTYKMACEEYQFKSTSSLYNYVNDKIKVIVED